MASKALKHLRRFTKSTPLERGLGPMLPEGYKKFYNEWKYSEPAAVNYVPENQKWIRNEVTNEVLPVQDVPLPLKYPKEYDEQLWGGEAVVQGFQKRDMFLRRNPHFWVPPLQRSVVYSEVLNKHISVIVTRRAIQLINANYGFDHYLLKTPACDLKSLLPLGLKRKVLQELHKGCPSYADTPDKQQEIFSRYKTYLSAYTEEEIEWYGYSLKDAIKKYEDQIKAATKVTPLKTIYRAELIEKLKTAKIDEANSEGLEVAGSTWMQKMNPFGKKQET
ncbi:PREDICTED: 39S ribosomal protein L28, mitochondrial [Nicrophorus vespilloides]|uniref:Large ribosomal subunit protein bL28m n=1 Tax=Nicrophorus vespilloides TaxID=110193 RepID=A0ABM1MM15_NICVS|nr:PREDICTED: 39S ribosomal protein L28, mitochondrial [Nicrophorus vespilloides]